jgi:hypothetical protein
MRLNLKILLTTCAVVFVSTSAMCSDGGMGDQSSPQSSQTDQGAQTGNDGVSNPQDQSNNGNNSGNPQEDAVKAKGQEVLKGAQDKALGVFDNLMGNMKSAVGGGSSSAAAPVAN